MLKTIRPTVYTVGNGKSGSSEACHILSSARKVLNAVQAIDLSDQEPRIALQLCALLKDTQCRLLIAGGDGTIAWVLNAVQDLDVNVIYLILKRKSDYSYDRS